jgi:1,2-diacylglycerol 3-alpha-glucosyltransferase
VQPLRVGLFTEVYRPVQNGVVACVEMLATMVRERGHQALCVAPAMRGSALEEEHVVRLPSLPLPTRTGYRLTLPILQRERVGDLSIVHAHSPFVTGWLGLRVARRLRVPLIFTYHTQLEQYAHYIPFEVHATRYAARRLTRAYANRADVVIVPTASMERHLRALGVGRRIEVVPGGIDLARFGAGKRRADLRASLGAAEDEVLVLWVGRLGKEKNPELALEAFARLPGGARMVAAGDGSQRTALERKAQRLAPGRVRFIGEQSRAALPDMYASADVFLFTSGSETQGLVLAEASAVGLAIVAVDAPQSRDVLGEAARFCEADPQALAQGIIETVAEGNARRDERLAVARRFDASLLASRVLDIYDSVVRRRDATITS